MFGLSGKESEKDKEKAGEKPPEQRTLNEASDTNTTVKKEPAKTTSDEGKTFSSDTVFVCVRDCFQKGTRYRKGDELTAKTCPPWFVVKPKESEKDKK